MLAPKRQWVDISLELYELPGGGFKSNIFVRGIFVWESFSREIQPFWQVLKEALPAHMHELISTTREGRGRDVIGDFLLHQAKT